MREYALTLAQPSLSTGLIPLALQCFKTAGMRRKFKKALLCHVTRSAIGLGDADLRYLLTLPMSCDVAMEIERIRFLAARDKCMHTEMDAA
jgi:hypothetical protein